MYLYILSFVFGTLRKPNLKKEKAMVKTQLRLQTHGKIFFFVKNGLKEFFLKKTKI